MRFSLMPLLLPPSILGAFAFGLHQLITNRFAHGFSLTLTIGAAVAAGIAVALHVHTVDNRLSDAETRIDRLVRRLSRDPDEFEAERVVRAAFGQDR